jgi:hypothetical protein
MTCVRHLFAARYVFQKLYLISACRCSSGQPQQLEDARQQLQGHQRERKAMQTILDTKMKSFMADALREVESMQAGHVDVPNRLVRSLGGLHRLLDATVQAMVNSDLHTNDVQ